MIDTVLNLEMAVLRGRVAFVTGFVCKELFVILENRKEYRIANLREFLTAV